MVRAMAWRAKYACLTPDGQVLRKRLLVENLGVHRLNRGGVYPARVRCRNQCVDIIETGFLGEDINHACIGVEEIPLEEFVRLGLGAAGIKSGPIYNVEQSAKDELLSACSGDT